MNEIPIYEPDETVLEPAPRSGFLKKYFKVGAGEVLLLLRKPRDLLSCLAHQRLNIADGGAAETGADLGGGIAPVNNGRLTLLLRLAQ